MCQDSGLSSTAQRERTAMWFSQIAKTNGAWIQSDKPSPSEIERGRERKKRGLGPSILFGPHSPTSIET